MDFKAQIAQCLSTAISSLSADANMPPEQILQLLERPKDESMGDIAFPCFLLSKALRKGPPAIAKELSESLKATYPIDFISAVLPTGPYINFKLKTSALGKYVLGSIQSGEALKSNHTPHEKVMIEFSQPNTHKAIHVGHVRNMALGDSLVRINRWDGYNVVGVNYIGDVGTHIAKCLWYFKNYFKGEIPTKNRGEFLGTLYAEASEMLDFKNLTRAPHPGVVAAQVLSKSPHPAEPKWSVVTVKTAAEQTQQVVCGGTGYEVGDRVAYAAVGQKVNGRAVIASDKKGVISEGVLCSEKEVSLSDKKDKIYVFPENTPLGTEIANFLKIPEARIFEYSVVEEMLARTQQVSDTLKKIEGDNPDWNQLWSETKEWSMQDLYEIYDWLDIHFDHYFYESDVAEPGKQIVKEYYDKGVFIKSEGAIGVDLSEHKLPFFMVLKSDGTGLYSTKDLALARLKFETFNVDRNIVVVDDGQSLHFKQVFKTLELMGYKNADKCYHLAYGQVERPDGKMSSRKGNVILFSELKELLTSTITSEFLEKYRGDWSDEEITMAARKISIATIKYGMLNQDSIKTIVFDLSEWTARTGNTGPYLMYAYARTQSILRDSGLSKLGADIQTESLGYDQLQSDYEHSLLNQLSLFKDVVQKARMKSEPQGLCIYLYQLAKSFSAFYTHCPVLKAPNEELKQVRLSITYSTGATLKAGLSLLGIDTLDRM